MYYYETFNFFLKKVEEKNFFAVKSILADIILRTKGNKDEIDHAIKYAEDNGAFKWETDDGRQIPKVSDTSLKQFRALREMIIQNFSKEKYNKILELCKEIYPTPIKKATNLQGKVINNQVQPLRKQQSIILKWKRKNINLINI